MKTRTNQPIELANTQDIEHLSDSFLNELKAGDIITKQTGNQKHTYIVTYKEEKHGICLTYVDCGYMETISYDYTNGHWVFNSKDVIIVPTESAKLYRHKITISSTGQYTNYITGLVIFNNSSEEINTLAKLKTALGVDQNADVVPYINPVVSFKDIDDSLEYPYVLKTLTTNMVIGAVNLSGTSKSLTIPYSIGDVVTTL